MFTAPTASNVMRAFAPRRALTVGLLLFGIGAATAATPWQLSIDIPGATFQSASDIRSNRSP